MCGFTGWFDPQPQAREVLEKMSSALVHRGPDASGIYLNGPVGLGHRRLSIIDLAASQQPMACGRCVLAYNGELYNFRSLRRELEALGHRFLTEGDTEVLLHALMEWKEAVLPRLQGMFAFAFWDGKSLLLARDHFGVKPLYICQNGERILFASEIKSLLEHPAVSREIDPDAIGLYLECQYIPAPHSIFRQVRKLPPAHYLRFPGGEPQRYWSPHYLPKFEGDEESAVDQLEKELRRSVQSMLVADVPLGAFVSGGIDSSLIASLMQQVSGKRAKIFSIALGEQEHASRVAAYLDAEYYPLPVNANDMIGALDQMFDEPFGDQAALPTLLLSQLTRQHVKVVLTGEGADEVFAGYSNYTKRLKEAHHCEKYRLLRYLYPFSPLKLRKNRLFKALSRPPSRRYTTIPSLFDREMHSSILQLQTTTALEDLAEPHYFACDSTEYLDRMLHIDQNLWLPDDLLTKVDRATMTHSLEARVPYLDHHLVEFAARLPSHFKLGKSILKKVASRGYLPPEITHRQKWGFVIPLHEWMEGELKPLMTDVLATLQTRKIFAPRFLKKRHHATRLFSLLSLELWFRRYAPNYRGNGTS